MPILIAIPICLASQYLPVLIFKGQTAVGKRNRTSHTIKPSLKHGVQSSFPKEIFSYFSGCNPSIDIINSVFSKHSENVPLAFQPVVLEKLLWVIPICLL